MAALSKRPRPGRLMCGRSMIIRRPKSVQGFTSASGIAHREKEVGEGQDRARGLGRGSPAEVAATTADQTLEAPMSTVASSRLRSLTALALVGVFFAIAFICNSRVSASSTIELASPLESGLFEPQETTGDFSKFTHTNAMHKRLPCLLCHRRETNSPRPLRPGKGGHLPCAGCHTEQFKNTGSPICTICHTDVQKGTLKPFPPLKSFRTRFEHSRHVGTTGVTCGTCHRPDRGGVALSIPARANAHVVCYQCHTPRAQSGGHDISSCGTCHELGGSSRISQSAQAFKVSFSHARHGAPQKLSCNDCHRVKAGLPQRKQVTAPLPLNHHAPAGTVSCNTCHNGKRTFGGDDFTSCKRCHQGPQWHF
jgi:c(7)-type cytochrome triheme protein